MSALGKRAEIDERVGDVGTPLGGARWRIPGHLLLSTPFFLLLYLKLVSFFSNFFPKFLQFLNLFIGLFSLSSFLFFI